MLKRNNRNFRLLTVIGLLIGLCFADPGLAQQKEIDQITRFISKKRVNAAYFIGAVNLLAMGKLNLNLQAQGLPAVPESHLSYGLGGYFLNRKLVFGGEYINAIKRNSPLSGNHIITSDASFYMLNVGYLLHQKKGLITYPFFSVGLGQLKLVTRINNTDSFNDISIPQTASESRLSDFICSLGIATDYFFHYVDKEKGKNNLVVGFRVGITFTPHRNDWRVNQIMVTDGPNMGISGPYIRIIIGLGGWAAKLIKTAIK